MLITSKEIFGLRDCCSFPNPITIEDTCILEMSIYCKNCKTAVSGIDSWQEVGSRWNKMINDRSISTELPMELVSF